MSYFFSHISNLAKKVKSTGTHLAKKVKAGYFHGSRKAQALFHDIQAFNRKIQSAAPILTEIVDITTDFVPGAAPVKRALRTGISAFNTISSLTEKLERNRGKLDRAVQNPNIQNVLSLFK